MRYNIKRLFKEITVYEKQIKSLRDAPHATAIDAQEYNRLKHASSLCKKYIGEEVVTRLNAGEKLDFEKDTQDWENSLDEFLSKKGFK